MTAQLARVAVCVKTFFEIGKGDGHGSIQLNQGDAGRKSSEENNQGLL